MALLGLSFILTSLLLAVGFDVHMSRHQYEESFSGRKLKEYGGYEYGSVLFEHVSTVSNVTLNWARNDLPVYVDRTYEGLKPYAKVARDLSLISYNVGVRAFHNVSVFISTKYPVAEYWYLYYLGFCFLPGPIAGIVQGHSLISHMKTMLPTKQMEQNLPVVRESFHSFWNVTKQGASVAYDVAKAQGTFAATYLKKSTWFNWGEFKKYTESAYDRTHTLATNTVSWIFNTVQTYTENKEF